MIIKMSLKQESDVMKCLQCGKIIPQNEAKKIEIAEVEPFCSQYGLADEDIPLIMENYELKKNIFKDNELEYYMKIIDIEEVEDELNREFDMDSIIVKRAMRVVRDCILDKED